TGVQTCALPIFAVALMPPVPVIRKEKRVAALALTSLRLWAHRAPTAAQPPRESKQNHRAEEKPRRRSKKSFQENSRKKRPRKKKGISNRRFSGNIISPLTTTTTNRLGTTENPRKPHQFGSVLLPRPENRANWHALFNGQARENHSSRHPKAPAPGGSHERDRGV